MQKRSWCSTLKIRFARAFGRESRWQRGLLAMVKTNSHMNWRELAQQFEQRFDQRPRIFRAPGRVNLIGEHTDYNDGFVMPAALGFSTYVAVAARPDRKLVIHSQEFPNNCDFDVDHLPGQRSGLWCDYIVGVAKILRGR